MQQNKLIIYPTTRAARQRVRQSLSSDGFLPTITTIGEFERKVLLVKNRTFIDQDRRTLILNEAAEFSNFKQLQIPREFFTFLKNSKFLFGFFNELSNELIEIKTLASYDTYASYHEHLEILQTLLSRYKQLLDAKNYVDKITLPSLYSINYAYLKHFEKIELLLEGYLSNFEFKIIGEIANRVPLTIEIEVSSFNQKMAKKFEDLGIKLDIGYQYTIDFSSKKILKKTKLKNNKTDFEIIPCQSQITQVAFVKKKIYDYTKNAIDPKDIVVVLPNSSFSRLLNLFDDKNNLNFAMGFSYKETDIFQKISAQYEYFTDRNYQNRYKLKRLGFDLERIDLLQKDWNKKHTSSQLSDFFALLITNDEKEIEKDIYQEELYIFSKLFKSLEHQPLHKILHLFLNRLKGRTIDDSRGGKVTVMEVLETRGVNYEAVILVDFNEGHVPASSQKDMFLSSELRYLTGLPTSQDRENLQKQYYHTLFQKAKHVSISYIDDEQNAPSRFLDELKISKYEKNIPSLNTILFKNSNQKTIYSQEDLVLEYDFTKVEISATSLKCFLECKRAYYFQYIKKLNSHEIPNDDNSNRIIGILLHDALKEAYINQKSYENVQDLKFKIQSYLYKKSELDMNLRFLVDVWLKKLDPFIEKEIKRANDGYIVKYVEKKFDVKVDDFTLIGQIDRIDEKGDHLNVIDYKSGKIKQDSKRSIQNISNFQLQFYHLLASQIGDVRQSYYYDLNSSKLVSDNLFDEKLDLLYKKLDELKGTEHNFTKSQKSKDCQNCPYVQLCGDIY